ncbi:hypothetical protein DAEQUDRAFT_731300 [Daedalea quercina L-15889]|uniref:Uncharacterized protein n=1 Tax=Daedalea quercina L-15889 TaxID=1314783 RepID=A0A165MF77_9APHY|nr:hypothetical protein DAEQUDRAFT_731300 [Daedalea quercina L-15889]
MTPRFDETVTSHGSKKASTTRGPFRIFAWLSNDRNHLDGKEEELDHCASAASRLGRTRRNAGTHWEEPAAVNRPPRVFTRQIIQMSYAPSTPSHDLRGLPPPPRHQRSRSHSPRESSIFNSVPSFSALGLKRRATSESRKHPAPSQLSIHQASGPYDKAGNTEDGDARGTGLTSSDEGETKGEVTSWTDEVVTQLTAISSGESADSRTTSAVGITEEGLDLTGTFGVLTSDS